MSNPCLVECKMNNAVKETVQALRYKWRDGGTGIDKYASDTTARTTPGYLRSFSRAEEAQFRRERFLWHLGLGLFRIGEVRARDAPDRTVPVISFNEEEVLVFNA